MRCDKSFLIVARNLDVQDLYVLQLRSERVAVLGVDTYEEAIRVCRSAPCGAVLFDIEDRSAHAATASHRRREEFVGAT